MQTKLYYFQFNFYLAFCSCLHFLYVILINYVGENDHEYFEKILIKLQLKCLKSKVSDKQLIKIN